MKLIKLILAITIVCITSFFYITKWSSGAKKTNYYAQKIQFIKLGMKKEDVLNIMGNPSEISVLDNYVKDSLFYYKPPFGSTSNIYIYFDSLGTVNGIQDHNDVLIK